jgi:hypothetical protein
MVDMGSTLYNKRRRRGVERSMKMKRLTVRGDLDSGGLRHELELIEGCVRPLAPYIETI